MYAVELVILSHTYVGKKSSMLVILEIKAGVIVSAVTS